MIIVNLDAFDNVSTPQSTDEQKMEDLTEAQRRHYFNMDELSQDQQRYFYGAPNTSGSNKPSFRIPRKTGTFCSLLIVLMLLYTFIWICIKE